MNGWWWALPLLAQFWLMWIQFQFIKQMKAHTVEVQRECCEAWELLIECKKVLLAHDDFNARHVVTLIDDLARKGIHKL